MVIEAFLAWLADFPRPTWVVTTQSGQSVVFNKQRARNRLLLTMYKGDWAQGEITRGTWMRPSELQAQTVAFSSPLPRRAP